MTTVAPTALPAPASVAPLTALDRCDRCGAQAYVEVASSATGLDLLFCTHHFEKLKVGLEAKGFLPTRDESWRLAPKSQVGEVY